MDTSPARRKNRTAADIPPPVDPLERLVPPAVAAPLAGYGTKKNLERDRRAGKGPPFYQVNPRVIRYRVGDLLAFRERFRVETEVA